MIRPLHYIEDIFGENGLFHNKIPGYSPRQEQIELASRVALALVEGSPTLVSEAPCGTGKTFAYLIPALYHRHWDSTPILISTAGIALQMQLVQKDLPMLKDLLSQEDDLVVPPFTFRLIKGVNNYACVYKMEKTLVDPEVMEDIANSVTGDRESLMHLTEETWERVSTTSDACDTVKCPAKDRCYYVQTRSQARRADVLVTNHHFLANMGEDNAFLSHAGKARLVILDEAHEYPAIARDAKSPSLFRPSVDKAIRKLRPLLQQGGDTNLPSARAYSHLTVLENRVESLFRYRSPLLFDEEEPVVEGTIPLVSQRGLLATDLLSIRDQYVKLKEMEAKQRGDTYESWSDTFYRRLSALKAATESASGAVIEEVDGTHKLHLVNTESTFLPHDLLAFSATLRCEKSYEPWLRQIDRAPSATSPVIRYTAKSPFDWKKQVRIIVPDRGRDPSVDREGYNTYVAETARKVVTLANGRTLVLCTSWTSVRAVTAALSGIAYTVLVQGTMGKQELIHRFKTDKHSVLVGTTGLWTGVDVPGDALSAIILDKLPFRTAETPFSLVQKAKDPRGFFSSYVLPEAVNLFAQGFGRLIRSTEDKGVAVLLDGRIFTKPYGQAFRDALPQGAPITYDLGDIAPFLENP